MTDEIKQTDFYIKLDSEADLPVALAAFYENEVLLQYTADYAMHIVGDIWKPTGKVLKAKDGTEYPETVKVDGYHINIRLINDNKRAEVEALPQSYPETPSCVWA